DAALAGGLEDLWFAALFRGHRIDDGALALEDLLVDIGVGDLLLDLAHAGQEAEHAGHAADLLHLDELVAQVLQIEMALLHLGGDLGRLLRIDRLGRTLDQGDDVAHAENAVGDAGGMEILERIDLFAGADELDRLAGDGAHRERRAAAAVA